MKTRPRQRSQGAGFRGIQTLAPSKEAAVPGGFLYDGDENSNGPVLTQNDSRKVHGRNAEKRFFACVGVRFTSIVFIPMLRFAPTRIARIVAASAFFAAALSLQVCAQSAPPSSQPNQAPIERHPPRPNTFKPGPARPNGEHLAEWMSHHSNLTLEQQQKALEAEPGFNALPLATQQHMHDTLTRLNAMTPEQRRHLLETNEAIERMTPAQYTQYRAALKQLNDLPPQQRVYVARTFRGLRELSPPQRQAVLNSERFNHLTDAQRATLNSLMQVEPLMPPPYDDGAPSHPSPQQ